MEHAKPYPEKQADARTPRLPDDAPSEPISSADPVGHTQGKVGASRPTPGCVVPLSSLRYLRQLRRAAVHLAALGLHHRAEATSRAADRLAAELGVER